MKKHKKTNENPRLIIRNVSLTFVNTPRIRHPCTIKTIKKRNFTPFLIWWSPVTIFECRSSENHTTSAYAIFISCTDNTYLQRVIMAFLSAGQDLLIRLKSRGRYKCMRTLLLNHLAAII